MRRLPSLPLLLLIPLLLLAGCAHLDAPWHGTSDAVTVEGMVSVRGNTPFTVLLLETDGGTRYILALDEAAQRDLQPRLPARYRATGTLYEATWAGQLVTHLRPTMLEPAR